MTGSAIILLIFVLFVGMIAVVSWKGQFSPFFGYRFMRSESPIRFWFLFLSNVVIALLAGISLCLILWSGRP
jgi:hypothetical protein